MRLTALTVERLFCAALLAEGTDVSARVLSRFIDYRNRKDEVLKQMGVVEDGEKPSAVDGPKKDDDGLPF